jgi:hypothetical protein
LGFEVAIDCNLRLTFTWPALPYLSFALTSERLGRSLGPVLLLLFIGCKMTAAFLATFGTALIEAESKELATASSDLLFLWEDNEIPPRVQLRLVTQYDLADFRLVSHG